MKKFNLDLVLKGAKVVDDKGNEWKFAAYNPDAKEPYQLIFWDDNGVGRASNVFGNVGTCIQLFMAPTERKEWIVRSERGVMGPFETKDAAEFYISDVENRTIHEITIIE